ncbi:MAG: NAD(P)-dependent oxidoreductase [Deltaproteobacteria bacterium]|nr:NAD(P)-dependent oxidoreductase [Deltaproteobacteria bacterium]
MNVGFIGLGHLGRAIAGRLIDQGHALTVWNRTQSKVEGLDVRVAAAPAEVIGQADIIGICLFDSNAVQGILTAENGLLAGEAQGKIFVDFSTNHYQRVEHFHDLCRRAGADYLETPVLGSVVPASQGALTVLASGRKQAFDTALPLLEDVGRHVFFLETPGLATKMKLVNNLTLGTFMAAIAEALALGEAAGIDREEVLDILAVGGGDSLVLKAKRAKLLHEDFSTQFSSALIHKDLHCLQDLAFDMKMPMPTGSAAKEVYAQTFAQGLDGEDFSAVYKLFKPRS